MGTKDSGQRTHTMGFSILGYEEGDEDRYLDEGVLENHPEPPEEVRHGSSQQITTVEDDVREEACNSSDQPPSHYDTTSMNNPPYQNLPNNSSILGDMTLFRDFFLAAFSDYNVSEHTNCLATSDTTFDITRWLLVVEVTLFLMNEIQ